MRVLKLLFSALVIFLVFATISFFISRESLLYLGSSRIKSGLRELSLARNKDAFISQCKQLGSTNTNGEDIVSYRLRFLSSQEFVLEAVCAQFPLDPIVIKRASLPQFVSKVAGTSGFELNTQSGIELQVFFDELKKIQEVTNLNLGKLSKIKVLVADDGVVLDGSNVNYLGNGPVTSCVGYGYQCCDEISSIGVGSKISGLVDCEQNCYLNCAKRPVILSFNTNPFINPRTRSLNIGNNETVEFTYVADAGKDVSVGGVIDFGDGKKAPVSGLAGQTSHLYSCTRSVCNYAVKLSLEDNWGVSSAKTGVSEIKVIVRR